MPLKKKISELKMVEKNGLLVPEHLANEAGVGCFTCDDHEMIPMSFGAEKLGAMVTKFLEKHKDCRRIQTLEKHEGKTFETGELVLKSDVDETIA